MKIYVAGPMTGIHEWNHPAFNAAAAALREAGYDVVNPADTGAGVKPWAYYMRLALKGLLECEAVAYLDGWEKSRGACLELHNASELGMKVKHVDEWLRDAV